MRSLDYSQYADTILNSSVSCDNNAKVKFVIKWSVRTHCCTICNLYTGMYIHGLCSSFARAELF